MKLKVLFLPLSIVISLIVVIWMAKPQYDDWQAKRTTLETEQESFNKIDSQLDQLEAAYLQYEAVGSDKQLIENALPMSELFDDSIAEIYQIVKNSGVLLQDLSISSSTPLCPAKNSENMFGQSQDAGNLVSDAGEEEQITVPPGECIEGQKFTISANGNYPLIKNFLIELGRTNRYTELETIEINKSNADDPSDFVNLLVTFSTFSKQKKEMTPEQAFATPVGQVLLQGKIEADVIDKYKTEITNRSFVPLTVGTFGKGDLFLNPNAVPPTATSTTTDTTSTETDDAANNLSPITEDGITTDTQ